MKLLIDAFNGKAQGFALRYPKPATELICIDATL